MPEEPISLARRHLRDGAVVPRTRWLGAALGLCALVLCSGVAMSVELQGHRGARGLWPENTLAGFEQALRIGVNVLELDVGLSKDDVPIVTHDPQLSADIARDASGQWLSGPGPILRHTSVAKLSTYDVGRLRPGSRYAKRFPEQRTVDGQRMPRLSEVFELVGRLGASHVRFNIEMKLKPGPSALYADPDTFARAVLGAIDAADMRARVSVQSFDWRALDAVRKLAPNTHLVALTAEQSWLDNLARQQPGPSPWTAGRDLDDVGGSVPQLVALFGAATWSPYWRDIDRTAVAEAQELGLKVVVWTVNEESDIRRVLDLGVDGIISDFPGRVRQVFTERGLALPPTVVVK
ncbi:MAG: glycerophosphodiester phosphodiesterase [Gammaproteobacteria bacterium]|nr:glycerophosphodiester phosphodiesterase [Gammaproteobacteria bacterium]